MGLNSDNVAQLQFESNFVYQKIVSLPNKKFGFEFTSNGQKMTLMPEQIFASYLKLLSLNMRN